MKISTLLFSLWMACLTCLPLMKCWPVEVIISDGMNNAMLKQKMEHSLSALLTEVNTAYKNKRRINYEALRLPPDVRTTLSLLWENSPFLCIDDVVSEQCLRRQDGKYEIRNIPLLLKAPQSKDDEGEYQEATVIFDAKGNLYSFHLAIAMNLYKKIIKSNIDVKDLRYRELILDFTERLRTAYNEHNLKFMEAIFSDDALIITGKVVERKTADGIRLPIEIQYKKQNKREYLTNLKRVFDQDRKKLIRVSFDEIEIMRHPNARDPEYARVYGVTLHQGYRAPTYRDDGYVFLLWDFTNEEKPKILVRTWQPDIFSKDRKTNTRIPKDEVFSIFSFDSFKEQKNNKRLL